MIYFIRASFKEEIFYKIGFTRGSAKQRLKQHQTSCPVVLELIKEFPGDLMDEQRIHAYLKCLRSHGEWFKHGPLIEQFLNRKDGEQLFRTPCPRKDFFRRLTLNI